MHPSLYDHVCVVDFETHYSDAYSLRSKHLSMTDYIRHPEFEVQCVSIWHDAWAHPQTVTGYESQELLESIDWTRTAFCAHHAQFDGLILTHHYSLQPCFWLDTISMYRMLHGVDVPASLDAAARAYGFGGKTKADALKAVKGKKLCDLVTFHPELLTLLMEYNTDDTHDTMGILRKMLPHVPVDELRIIDMTVRMYTEPMLELSQERLEQLHKREADRRAAAIAAAEVDTVTLGSAQRFADHLRSLGVTPPMKISPRTQEPTYAFAKTDLEFKALLKHDDPLVRAAVEARLTNKSSLVENRSQRLLQRVGLPTPMYYNYWAARTGRWGGGDKVNWQNLAKKGDGAELRKSLEAPEGMAMIIADASQIEARVCAWLAGDAELLEAFSLYDRGLGPDIYCVNASGVFGFAVDKEQHPDERFLGKVLSLSCQYGAGGVKVSNVFRLGNLGPAIDMSVAEAKDLVQRWRSARNAIVKLWHRLGDAAEQSWLQGIPVELGPLGFELYKGAGYMHLPNGTYMKYPGVGWNANAGELYYNSRNGYVKVWGGYLAENACQALSCVLLKQQMLKIMDAVEELRIASTTHDEMVNLVWKEDAEQHAELVRQIMSSPEDWAKGLPLNAEVTVSEIYSKT